MWPQSHVDILHEPGAILDAISTFLRALVNLGFLVYRLQLLLDSNCHRIKLVSQIFPFLGFSTLLYLVLLRPTASISIFMASMARPRSIILLA
jgi:hypothetical protein